MQRVVITDAPGVLGLDRFIELDERYAFTTLAGALRAAADAGKLRADDPATLARLLLGMLTRGGMLIASSPDPQSARDDVVRSVRNLLTGLREKPGDG